MYARTAPVKWTRIGTILAGLGGIGSDNNVSLSDAEAAILVLPDPDIEDGCESVPGPNIDEEILLDVEQEDEKEDQQENEDNIPLSVLAARLQPKTEKPWTGRNVVFHHHTPPEYNVENYNTPFMYFSKYSQNEVFTQLAEKNNMLAEETSTRRNK